MNETAHSAFEAIHLKPKELFYDPDKKKYQITNEAACVEEAALTAVRLLCSQYNEAWFSFLRYGDNLYDWKEEAEAVAIQCWEEAGMKDLDAEAGSKLSAAFARHLASWVQTAAQNQRNTEFYRDLIQRCGKAIGERAYTADDGSRAQDVLALKVPEIIEADYAKLNSIVCPTCHFVSIVLSKTCQNENCPTNKEENRDAQR